MAHFSALTTTQLGNYGETFITEFAKSLKLKPYIPALDESFPVDSICISTGFTLMAIEAKTKPRMKYYDKTGYDARDHETYLKFPFPVWVMFIDFLSGSIYGNYAHSLNEVKEEVKSWVLFPLSAMTEYRKLNEEEITELKKLNRSRYC